MKRPALLVLVLAFAVAACGSPVENATATLIEQVRLGDPLAQQTYAENQELLESEEAFSIWMDTLRNSDSPQVQSWAAQMLGNIGNPEALPALAEAMDGSRGVRDAAVGAIRQFEQEQSTEAFVTVLENGSRDAQAIALAQLSRVGGDDAIDAVQTVAMSGDPLLGTTATNTLGDIGSPAAASALADMASDPALPADVRSSAIANLARLDSVDEEMARVIASLEAEEGADELLAQAQAAR